MIQLVKIAGEAQNYREALKGTWGYEGKDSYYLTINKGVAHLETPIAEGETELSLSLPTCYDFFAQINSESGCRFVKVTDSSLKATLSAGEQINTNFKVK